MVFVLGEFSSFDLVRRARVSWGFFPPSCANLLFLSPLTLNKACADLSSL